MLKKGIFPLFLVLQVFLSCANDLIPESTVSQISSGITVSKELVPPSSVYASNGDYRCVKLSWNIAQNAARYNIYSTDSLNPSNAIFEKAGETKDGQTTSVIIQENSGITKYYCVTSVDLDGNESIKSNYVSATTLATPEITSIEEAENGTEITVNWYLDNCRDESSPYFNDLRFVLHLYDSTMNEIKDKESSILHAKDFSTDDVPGAVVKYSYTFKDLTSKTKYYFMVEAFTFENPEENPSKIERSDKLDAETARMMTPKKVSDLYIEKGVAIDALKVSFTLPEFCEYKESDSTYSRHPLYFKVERRYSGVENAQWETVINKLSSVEETKKEKLIYNFKLGENDTDCGDFKITTKASTDSSMESNSNYENYIQGSLITLSFDVERGIKYDFRIQSYVDDTIKILSSEDAVAEDTGWLVSVPSFNVDAQYLTNEENPKLIDTVNISFNFKFETMGLDTAYIYKIEEKFEKFNDLNDLTNLAPAVVTDSINTKSISDVNLRKFEKLTEDDVQGYYTYTFTLLDASEQPIELLPESKKIIVLKNSEKIPQVEAFTVKDGYSNKFAVSWKNPPSASFTLKWKALDETGTILNESQITEEELKTEAYFSYNTDTGLVEVDLPADSGDIRQFSLSVKSAIEVTVYDEIEEIVNGEPRNVQATRKTLGTPSPNVVEYDYSTIKVQWNEVQMSDVSVDGEGTVTGGFKVSAKYRTDSLPASFSEDQKNALKNADPAVTQKITEEILGNGKKLYTCVITNPYGYDNPLISGLPIDLTVTAKSKITEDETNAKIETETVGPALLNIQTGVIDNTSAVADDLIKVKWNKVKGAKGYIIQRIINDTTVTPKIQKADTYYYDEIENVLSVISDDITIGSRAFVTKSRSETTESFLLTDRYIEPDEGFENNAYQMNQSKISWGIEYDYVILPVKENEGKSDDFKFDSLDFLLLTDDSVVNYTKQGAEESIVPLASYAGATFGYGQNIKADKAQNGRQLTVTFTKPFYKEYSPSIYRRKYATEDELALWNADPAKYATELSDYRKWEKINPNVINSNNLSYIYTPNYSEGYTPYDYIVKYNSTSDILSVPNSLENLLKTKLEDRYTYPDGVSKEEANKGYLQNINLRASCLGEDKDIDDPEYYTEQVTWEKWDFTKARLGPSNYKIYMMNPDLQAEWILIANIGSTEAFEQTTKTEKETVMEKFQTVINLTPEGYADGTKTNTGGLLKVLRNPKHYYKVVLNSNDVLPTVEIGGDEEISKNLGIFGYRQITDEELTKCACLIIADAIYQGGISTGGIRTTQGNVGSFFTNHHSSSKTLTWGTNNEDYVHVFRGGVPSSQNKDFISPFIVKIESYEKDYCVNYAHLFNLVHNKIEISCKEIPLSTYNGILKINAGKEGIATTFSAKDFYCLSLTLNEKKMVDFTDNNKTEYQKWFPINMFSSDRDSPITEFTESEPLYNGEWW